MDSILSDKRDGGWMSDKRVDGLIVDDMKYFYDNGQLDVNNYCFYLVRCHCKLKNDCLSKQCVTSINKQVACKKRRRRRV